MKNKTEIPAAEAAHAAKQASFALAAAPGKARSSALLAVAAALRAKANMVFKANEIDMRQAEKEGLAAPALKRLKFDAHKLEDVCAGLEQLAAMEDPIGREQLRTELADGLVLSRVSCPIGVIGVIFESRPDALIQIGGLCLKSGNAVLLKGGREAMRTNEALFDILRDASVATGMPDGWCGLLTTREDVSVMLKMDEDIDLIIYSTITPDEVVPTCAAVLRRRLGLVNAAAFDMNAACSGFIYGLTIAETMMSASAPGAAGAAGRNPIHRALVVGGERLTRIVDWNDRNTCVLFGDGAGAAVVEWDERKPGILAWYIKNDDDDSNALTCPSAYDAPQPFTPEGIDADALQQADPGTAPIDAELDVTERVAAGAPRQALYMNGQKVFKFATSVMPAAIEEVLRRANLTIDDVQFIVPHQANLRIIKYAAKRMVSIAHRGNSSSACIPMTLCDAYESGNIHPGDKVVLVGFGGGFTSGAVLYEA